VGNGAAFRELSLTSKSAFVSFGSKSGFTGRAKSIFINVWQNSLSEKVIEGNLGEACIFSFSSVSVM
jgi:hypothetical protein